MKAIYQTVLRILLGFFLMFAGVSHLWWARSEFLAQVPKWLPMSPDLVVILSGIVEIGLGIALTTLHSYQRKVGIIVALFFVAIFPGNINQYVHGIDAFGLNTDTARLIRLFFQPVLILWALWSTGFFRKK